MAPQFMHPNVVVRFLGPKGMGLVSRQRINRGTRIILERPLIRASLKEVMGTGSQSAEEKIAHLLQKVPVTGWLGFWQLHDAMKMTSNEVPFELYRGTLAGKFQTNAFHVPGTEDGAVYLATSRINHSCIPNSVQSHNNHLGHLTIHAVREISDEEEITISYLPTSPVLPYAFRQKRLAQYGFRCECPLCAVGGSAMLAADCKLHLAFEAYTRLREHSHIIKNPDEALKDAKFLAKTYGELGLETALPNAYHAAIVVLATHGDERRAKVFAERVLEWQTCIEGSDGEDVKAMQGIVRDPKTAGLSGVEGKWKECVEEIPVGLDKVELERWGWREYL